MTQPRLSGTVIVGSGVAGLTTALRVGSATILTKGSFGADGSSDLAQGGVAAAVGATDSPASHAADTVDVSGGVGDEHAAKILTHGGPDSIDWLIRLGARFDQNDDGDLVLGREAGHSARRIVHADGDATGAEIMRTLRRAIRARGDITVIENVTAVDLIRSGERVVGVLAADRSGTKVPYLGAATVIATGGIGQLYSRTTNPPPVTGDGIAMAGRAGADLADLEFVQFHPTALAAGTDPMPLLTEALRGEGAVLVDESGTRFMPAVHRDAELAPRDVVARAIWAQLAAGHQVFLDSRRAVGVDFPDRFPTVFGFATAQGLDPRVDVLPVSPAVHYYMGGVAVDDAGRSSVPGLWAVGEAASTGVHGANRLASNSLLEGLVYGQRVAASIAAEGDVAAEDHYVVALGATAASPQPWADQSLFRQLMWRSVGIVRDAAGLLGAVHIIESMQTSAASTIAGRNATFLGRLIALAALARTESRGGHHRADHADQDPELAARSLVVCSPGPTEALSVTSGLVSWAS